MRQMSASRPRIQAIASNLFDQRLLLGSIAEVSPNSLTFSLQRAGVHNGVHLQGARHGMGEVGEYVVILSEHVLILARIVKIETRQTDFKALQTDRFTGKPIAAQAIAHPLGTIDPETLVTLPGVQTYPRINDPVYSAPSAFLAALPKLTSTDDEVEPLTLNLGYLAGSNVQVEISPEDLLSRHCAIVGSTGSGKSWTVSRVIEESLRHNSKTILIDSTGEYTDCYRTDTSVEQAQVGGGAHPNGTMPTHFPPSSFSESEFFALFSPSLQTQAPVLTDAIRSLRVLRADPSADDGTGHVNRVTHYQSFKDALDSENGQRAANDLYGDFDISKLAEQIRRECIKLTYQANPAHPFEIDKRLLGNCETLLLRVRNIVDGHVLPFRPEPDSPQDSLPFSEVLDNFLQCKTSKLLIVDISSLDALSMTRPIVVNAIGTLLMARARTLQFKSQPVVCVLDEAHNFIGKSLGRDEGTVNLSGFESIAREGRKFNLCLCLATQRPRDLSESILSQMGALVTHRLTNDYDRKLVERASGDSNSSVTQFLPDLRTGEALIFGTQIPIPLDLQIAAPRHKPRSESADFQKSWRFANNQGHASE